MFQSVAPSESELHGQATYQFILRSLLKALIMDSCHDATHQPGFECEAVELL